MNVKNECFRAARLGNGQEIEDKKHIPALLAIWGVGPECEELLFVLYILPVPEMGCVKNRRMTHEPILTQGFEHEPSSSPKPSVYESKNGESNRFRVPEKSAPQCVTTTEKCYVYTDH